MKAKQFFFAMIGLTLAALIGTGGVFYIFNGRLSKTIDSISQREEDITIAEIEIKNLDELEKDLLRIESIKPQIDAALPRGKTQSDSLAQILDIARANSINFRTISFQATQGLPAENSQTQPSKVVPAVSSIPITLETETVSYDTLKSFLRDVLAIRRNANVATLSLTRDSERPGNVKASIVIDIHLEKVAEQISDEEKAKRLKEAEAQSKESN